MSEKRYRQCTARRKLARPARRFLEKLPLRTIPVASTVVTLKAQMPLGLSWAALIDWRQFVPARQGQG